METSLEVGGGGSIGKTPPSEEAAEPSHFGAAAPAPHFSPDNLLLEHVYWRLCVHRLKTDVEYEACVQRRVPVGDGSSRAPALR